MNRIVRSVAPLLALCAGACDRPDRVAAPAVPDKSVMRPAIQAEAGRVPTAPAAPEIVTIPFAYDGATLDDAARAALDRLARTPTTAAATSLVIRGHTDASGSDRANLHVSMARATAVRDYLVAAGVTVPTTLIALGERRPIRPSATPDGVDDPAGRAANRRVEITLR